MLALNTLFTDCQFELNEYPTAIDANNKKEKKKQHFK